MKKTTKKNPLKKSYFYDAMEDMRWDLVQDSRLSVTKWLDSCDTFWQYFTITKW